MYQQAQYLPILFSGNVDFFLFVLNIYHFNLKNIFYHMISEWDMS